VARRPPQKHTHARAHTHTHTHARARAHTRTSTMQYALPRHATNSCGGFVRHYNITLTFASTSITRSSPAQLRWSVRQQRRSTGCDCCRVRLNAQPSVRHPRLPCVGPDGDAARESCLQLNSTFYGCPTHGRRCQLHSPRPQRYPPPPPPTHTHRSHMHVHAHTSPTHSSLPFRQ
jgi:hypothetical protein